MFKSRSFYATVTTVLVFFGLSIIEEHTNVGSYLTARDGIQDETRRLNWNKATPSANVAPYSILEIERAAIHITGYVPRILVFDGQKFALYNLLHRSLKHNLGYGGRAVKSVPLLVHALKQQFPGRFEPGQPPFQIMYTDGDSIHSKCFLNPKSCKTYSFPPVLTFGSVPKDPVLFPTAKAFPNWFYIDCLYEWKIKGKSGSCQWRETSNLQKDDIPAWNDLVPTIVWRGTDHAFMDFYSEEFRQTSRIFTSPVWKDISESQEHVTTKLFNYWNQLTPRWRGVALTLQDEYEREQKGIKGGTPWIDVKFTGPSYKNFHEDLFHSLVDGNKMTAQQQAKYKYLIDFGGGGGTTWRGTLTKLNLPGLLFHHETPMQDWFFDLLLPWIHYIPVKWDLSDLKERFDWVEANPKEAEKIAKESTVLGRNLLSEQYMSQVYNELFVEYLGKVVKAYQPPVTTDGAAMGWQGVKKLYGHHGFDLVPVSECDERQCDTQTTEDQKLSIRYSF